MSNNSMDLRAKQRFSYQHPLVSLTLRVAGFAPRDLNRYVALSKYEQFC